MKKLFFGNIENTLTTDFTLTLVRVFIGLSLMLAHGAGKIPVSEGFIEHVEQLGLPFPALLSWSAALSEYVGAFLIAVGLFTRPAAFFVAVTMFIAAFVNHAGDPFGSAEKGYLYFAFSLIFLVIGSGRFSLDSVVRRRLNI